MFHIEELVLRIPGVSEEEGQNLGTNVAQQLLSKLQGIEGNHNLADLHLQLSTDEISDKNNLAAVITDKILFQLSILGR